MIDTCWLNSLALFDVLMLHPLKPPVPAEPILVLTYLLLSPNHVQQCANVTNLCSPKVIRNFLLLFCRPSSETNYYVKNCNKTEINVLKVSSLLPMEMLVEVNKNAIIKGFRNMRCRKLKTFKHRANEINWTKSLSKYMQRSCQKTCQTVIKKV